MTPHRQKVAMTQTTAHGQFNLSIDLGTKGTGTSADVARALRDVAAVVERDALPHEGQILVHGHSVGDWDEI
jgi:hypothetical protein